MDSAQSAGRATQDDYAHDECSISTAYFVQYHSAANRSGFHLSSALGRADLIIGKHTTPA
jgi:hypothetical protein